MAIGLFTPNYNVLHEFFIKHAIITPAGEPGPHVKSPITKQMPAPWLG